MEPIDIFSTIIKKFVSRPLKAISFNFTNPTFKMTALSNLELVYTFVYAAFSVSTCFETNISQCSQSLALGALAPQLSAKAIFCAINHVQLRRNIKLITNLYEANKTNGVNKDDLRTAARINLLLAKLFAVSILGTAAILGLSPILVYVFTGQVMPLMQIKIPFITTETFVGYVLHFLFHMFGLVNASLGLAALDTFIITTTIHIWPMTRILERAVTDLNRRTQSIRRDSITNSVWLKLRMRNIILMHREIYSYVRSTADMTYPLTTAELYTDQTVLIILVYCVLQDKWIPGIVIFMSIATKLLAICVNGTAVDYLNDKTYEVLANIDCTMLPEAEKKHVMIMLHLAQNPPTIEAGLVQLNLKLFAEVVKTIYTLGMLLLESF